MTQTLSERLSRLVLSANELRELNPDWHPAQIEDYLNILENTILIAEEVDGIEESRTINRRNVSTTPYEASLTDDILWVDATAGDITINLLPSATAGNDREGRAYQIEKVDSSDNKVIVNPSGSELINGYSSFELLCQYEYIKPSSNQIGWIF